MTENLEIEVILPPLPVGWAWARVEDLGVLGEQTVLTGPFGSNLGRNDFVSDQENAVPVLTIGCLQSRGINRGKAVFVAADKAAQMERYRLRHGDIMFSRMATVGRAGLIERAYEGALFNYHLMRLRLERSVIEPYFFIYFVRGAQVVVDHVRSVNHGMTRDGINTEQLFSMPVAVAPRQEQERIVSAIESYFTRLDDAVATLERVERNLKRYRASVLKSAVEGRLVPTEAALAKQEGRDYEPASVLLERILIERRRRWAESGKKGKYQEPTSPDTSNLPELTEGWCWATVDQLTSGDRSSGYGVLVPGPDVPDGVLLVRVGDIRNGRVHLDEIKRIAKNIADQFQRTYLHGGELLLSLVGSIGRTAVVPNSLAGANVARAVGVIPIAAAVNCRWVEHWFRSPLTQARMVGLSHEVARKTLNLEDVRAAAVALPPRLEQTRIVEAVSDFESLTDANTLLIAQTRQRATRLRQAILKWAFEGKLADQDPSDEPASVLLARIKAERDKTQPAKKKSRA